MISGEGDAHAIWQGSNADQQGDLPTTDPAQSQQLLPPQPQNEPDEEEEQQDTSLSTWEKLGKFARKFSPVLVPLPFAALIFLFTLPVALRNQAYLPPVPMAVLLIALVVMQGTMLYYAGSNDTLWTLYVVIGYVLFLLVGTLAIFGFFAMFILLIILLVIGALLARRWVRQIPEGFVDIVLSFGKYRRTLHPGLNFVMPWEKVHSRQTTKEISWTCPEQTVNISRDQDVKLVATISYQLKPDEAHVAALNVNNWEESLHKLFIATLQSVINELTPADFVSWSQSRHARTSVDISATEAAAMTRWDRINASLAQKVQNQVLNWGIHINFVRIQDITLIPHLAPSTMPGLAARPVDAGMPRGAPPGAVQPLQAQVVGRPSGNQQAPAPGAAPTGINIDALKAQYEAVRAGHIKDPRTIRSIAIQFEALANNPSIDFDAARAAQNLNQRARLYEEKGRTRAIPVPDIPTQPNTIERRPTNDNMWSGG